MTSYTMSAESRYPDEFGTRHWSSPHPIDHTDDDQASNEIADSGDDLVIKGLTGKANSLEKSDTVRGDEGDTRELSIDEGNCRDESPSEVRSAEKIHPWSVFRLRFQSKLDRHNLILTAPTLAICSRSDVL